MPTCPTCGNPMALLLLTAVCEHCEAKVTDHYHAFIVWRSRPPGACEYIFPTIADCSRWRAALDLDRFPIREVTTHAPPTWRQSTGSVRDIVLARQLYQIWHDSETCLAASQKDGSCHAYLKEPFPS